MCKNGICLCMLVAVFCGAIAPALAVEAVDGDTPGISTIKSGSVWYVKPAASGGSDSANGQTWATAFATIQHAVNNASFGEEIWVAEGVHTRMPGPVIVTMKNGVDLYGGFAGTESQRDQRDWATNLTRIDGQNMYRCVNGANNARIDGFIIQNGYRNVGKDNDDKYDFDHYDGAGMYNRETSPVVENCIFLNNRANANGGGMGNRFGNPTVINCAFIGNITGAGVNGGGGIHNYGSSPLIINCSFFGNQGGIAFGGMQSEAGSNPTVRNSIFWGNPGAGEIGSPAWDTGNVVTITHSCVQGGFSGLGNIALNPLFVNASADDLRLRTGSPCLGAASATYAPARDILGLSRPQGAGYDMGAYEGAYDVPAPSFTVTFNLDGKGTRTGGGALVQTVQEGQAAVAPTVIGNTGWTFTGWDVPFNNITGNLTVTAQYATVTFTVTFDLDGKGTRTGGGALVQTIEEGQSAMAPTVEGAAGWTFTGWDAPFDNIADNLTVTAQYTAEPEGEDEIIMPAVRIIGRPRVEENSRVVLTANTVGMVGAIQCTWYKDDLLVAADMNPYVIFSVLSGHQGVYVVHVEDESKALFISPPFVLQVLPEGSLPASGLTALGALAALLAAAGAYRVSRKRQQQNP